MDIEIKKLEETLASYNINDESQRASFKKAILDKSGLLSQLLKQIPSLPLDERKKTGKQLNQLKQIALKRLETHNKKTNPITSKEQDDITLPPLNGKLGGFHPLYIMQQRIIKIFEQMGFDLVEGNEIEDDYHNFTALNFSKDHTAREMQDSFFLDKGCEWLLRTHTSATQIRTMEKLSPPISIISSGRVFRKETISARSHCMFHQIEGLYIDNGVSIANLKSVLLTFLQELFGNNITIRLRPSFFPFTEPSVEVDCSCLLCEQKGCSLCKNSGWLEVLGAGMVHPNILINHKIDIEKYSGFAFGLGIERLTMLYYRIDDIRLFTNNNINFLSQFQSIQ